MRDIPQDTCVEAAIKIDTGATPTRFGDIVYLDLEYLEDGHFSGWQFLPPPAGLHPGHGHQASEVQHQEAGQEGGRPRERDVRQVCPLQEKCHHHLLVLELSLNTNKKQKERSLVIGGHRDVSDSPEPINLELQSIGTSYIGKRFVLAKYM